MQYLNSDATTCKHAAKVDSSAPQPQQPRPDFQNCWGDVPKPARSCSSACRLAVSNATVGYFKEALPTKPLHTTTCGTSQGQGDTVAQNLATQTHTQSELEEESESTHYNEFSKCIFAYIFISDPLSKGVTRKRVLIKRYSAPSPLHFDVVYGISLSLFY